MFYAFESNGKLRHGEATEVEIQRMAMLYETEIQEWSHDITRDDARPIGWYDHNGNRHEGI